MRKHTDAEIRKADRHPAPPAPHFPSPYDRPSVPPAAALRVPMADGAQIAAFVYAPTGVADAPGTPFAIDRTVPPVVLLHGNGEEHGIFGPVIDAVVASGRSVVALDSRAQGRSTRGTAALTYELMAADAWEALARLGVTLFHLAGFSDGAIEALVMARDRPQRVLSLLSVGANLVPEGVVDEEGWDPAALAKEYGAWADWVETLPADGPVDPDLLTPSAAEARTTSELMRLMADEPHIEAEGLADITCPTTVMAGELDAIEPRETSRIAAAIRAGGADVRLLVVQGCGHSIPKRAPQALAEALFEVVGQGDVRWERRPLAVPAGLATCRMDASWGDALDGLYLDVCQAEEERGTSGWVRGVWPPEGLARRYAEAGTTWCAFDAADAEGDKPRPGARPLGAVSLDCDTALGEDEPDWEELPEGAALTMHLLATSPAARGRGVAHALVGRAVVEARARGCRCIRINTSPENVPANRLYHSLGFRLHRPVWNPYPGLPISGWTNVWELPLTGVGD